MDQTFEETDRKNNEKVREIDDNGDEPLAEKKNTEENEENGRQNPARRKTERAKESHDRCSQPPGMRMPKTADLGTQALLVVHSFKLHLNSFVTTT